MSGHLTAWVASLKVTIIFRVDFSDEILDHQTQLKVALLRQHNSVLPDYAFDGSLLYSTRRLFPVSRPFTSPFKLASLIFCLIFSLLSAFLQLVFQQLICVQTCFQLELGSQVVTTTSKFKLLLIQRGEDLNMMRAEQLSNCE